MTPRWCFIYAACIYLTWSPISINSFMRYRWTCCRCIDASAGILWWKGICSRTFNGVLSLYGCKVSKAYRGCSYMDYCSLFSFTIPFLHAVLYIHLCHADCFNRTAKKHSRQVETRLACNYNTLKQDLANYPYKTGRFLSSHPTNRPSKTLGNPTKLWRSLLSIRRNKMRLVA